MPHALTRKTFVQRAALALGGTLLASAVQAQAPVEVQFYYPVAVGGAIAKTMDGFAEGFMKDNPGIKVSPIYAGTYLTGRAAQSYLANGKSWGERGPKRVVEDILGSLDRDSILRDARAEILAKLKS